MANNRNTYREKTHPALTVLYIIVVLALIVAIVFMYRNWQQKQLSYVNLKREAAENERSYELEARQREQAELEEELAAEATPEPTAEPTATPTAVPAPTAVPTDEPMAAAQAEVSLPGVNDTDAFDDADFEDPGFGNDPVVNDELADNDSEEVF